MPQAGGSEKGAAGPRDDYQPTAKAAEGGVAGLPRHERSEEDIQKAYDAAPGGCCRTLTKAVWIFQGQDEDI